MPKKHPSKQAARAAKSGYKLAWAKYIDDLSKGVQTSRPTRANTQRTVRTAQVKPGAQPMVGGSHAVRST